MAGGDVLVVDDDPDVRVLLGDALGLLGLEFRMAESGAAALKLIEARRPAAIVLDLMMPEMDGLSLLALLRQDAAQHDIPVIIMSALIDIERRAASMPGVVGVIQKGDFEVGLLRDLLVRAGVIAA
jgi:CheY-like chemotaxis protein